MEMTTIICGTIIRCIIIVGAIYAFCFLLKEKKLPPNDTFKVALFVLVIFADIYVASIDNIANNAPIWGVLGTLSGVLVTKLLNSTDKTGTNPQPETNSKEESKIITHK